jgi:hypothetical protein
MPPAFFLGNAGPLGGLPPPPLSLPDPPPLFISPLEPEGEAPPPPELPGAGPVAYFTPPGAFRGADGPLAAGGVSPPPGDGAEPFPEDPPPGDPPGPLSGAGPVAYLIGSLDLRGIAGPPLFEGEDPLSDGLPLLPALGEEEPPPEPPEFPAPSAGPLA